MRVTAVQRKIQSSGNRGVDNQLFGYSGFIDDVDGMPEISDIAHEVRVGTDAYRGLILFAESGGFETELIASDAGSGTAGGIDFNGHPVLRGTADNGLQILGIVGVSGMGHHVDG